MLRIRFFRTGRKRQPFYKIVVTDKNNPPSGGRFVEDVGFYNPLTKECNIKEERVKDWMEKGAQLSDRVHNLLIKKGVITGKKAHVASKAKKIEKTEPETTSKSPEKKIETEAKEEVDSSETNKEAEESGKEEEIKEEADKKEEKEEIK